MPIWEELFGPRYVKVLEFCREANESNPEILAESSPRLKELHGMPLEELAFRIAYADLSFTNGKVRPEALAAAHANIEVMLRTWLKSNYGVEVV